MLFVAIIAALALFVSSCGKSGNGQAAGPGDTGGQPPAARARRSTAAASWSAWRRDQRLEPGRQPVGRCRQHRRLVGARAAGRRSDADKGAKPWLADSWIANETFDAWVIKLHPNVKFQNGEDFDAAAVKKNIEFYLNGAALGASRSGR